MSSIYLPDSESVIDVMDSAAIGDPESFDAPSPVVQYFTPAQLDSYLSGGGYQLGVGRGIASFGDRSAKRLSHGGSDAAGRAVAYHWRLSSFASVAPPTTYTLAYLGNNTVGPGADVDKFKEILARFEAAGVWEDDENLFTY